MVKGNVAHYIHSASECLLFRNILNILQYTYTSINIHTRNVKFAVEVAMKIQRGSRSIVLLYL
jgi:hypothetical protein